MHKYYKILISIMVILLIALAGVSIYAYNLKYKQIKDCDAIGYTKVEVDCPNGFVRCMYDLSKVYCRNSGGKQYE